MAKKSTTKKKAAKKKEPRKKKAAKKKVAAKKPAKRKVPKAELAAQEAARQAAAKEEAERREKKELCAQAQNAVLAGEVKKAGQATKAALDANVAPSELLSKVLIPIIDEVGRRFDRDDFSLTNLMISARALYRSLGLITAPAELYAAVLTGDAETAEGATKEALAAGVDPQRLAKEGVICAMEEVGRRFECNEFFVPELLIAQRAMRAAAQHLGSGDEAGRVVIGTVQGDLHDIGKNLVAAMLQGCGFQVIDLGVDVSADAFIQSVQEKKAHIVALSALLTTTMVQMKAVIETLKKAGIRDKVKVIIGGAPITQQYADEIGADGYSDNASAAVNIARKLVA